MRAAALLGAGLVALAAPPASAQRILPCAPPIEEPLTLTIAQSLWDDAGQPVTVTTERTLRFGRDADGPWLEASAPRATSTLTGAAAARLAATMDAEAPLMRVRLDDGGKIIGIVDEATHWAAFLAKQQALMVDAGQRGGANAARVDAIFAALRSASPERRRAILAGFVDPLLRHCGAVLPPDAAPAGARIAISEVRDSAAMRERVRYEVSALTGLAEVIERETAPLAQPDRPFRDLWTLRRLNR